MRSNWNVEDVTAKYWSIPARIRDLIKEIKQRADLRWSWAMQMVIKTSTMSSDWNVKDMNAKHSNYFAKFRDLIREIKQRADLGWSWAVCREVIGMSRIWLQIFQALSPSSKINQWCYHSRSRFIGWSPKQLDRKFYLKDFQQKDSQKVFNWIDLDWLRNGIIIFCH